MSVASSSVWEARSLREVVTKLVDGSHNPPPKQDTGLPMLSARNIDRGQVLFDDYRLISKSAFVSENARTRIAPGDVLLTIVGTIGRTAVVPEGSQPFSLQRSVAVLTPSANLLPKFLCYQLQSPAIQRHFEVNARGTAQKGVYLKTLGQTPVVLPPVEVQREIVAELEKQFSRLDEAVANLQRVKANLKRYERATIASLTNPESFEALISGSIADIAISLDNMRKPVNKLERAKRPGNVPYLGANGQTGWIDVSLFDEELVLVVEDETFVGRTAPFCYYFAEKCWVNNHTHVLRARPEVVSAKYLNLALSYYPFIPLTTGSTGRRKLTKAALMAAPICVPSLKKQAEVVGEVERCLSIAREVEAEVDANLKRAQALRQATLASAFGTHH